MSDKTPVHLIIQALINELNDDDLALLNAWKAASTENVEVFNEIKRTWELSKEYKPPLEFDHESAFHDFLEKYVHKESKDLKIHEDRAGAPAKLLKPGKVYLPAAAALFILLAAVFVWYNFLKNPAITHQTLAGETAEFTLPDHSSIWLNEFSTFTFKQRTYEKNREVKLLGTGYFEVLADPDNPFTVLTPDLDVVVTGTAFQVNQSAIDEVFVAVDEGQVEILRPDDDQLYIVSAGEQAVLTENGSIEVKYLPSPNHAAWKNKGLSFISTPLEIVLQDLESFYKVNFSIEANLTGNLSAWTSPNLGDPGLEQVLELIEQYYNIRFEKGESQTYSIKEK